MAEVQKQAVAGLAFDLLADRYDSIFTLSAVGRAQREVVWEKASKVFSPGNHILELNCGTGEDAIFLAKSGMKITACDASAGMVEQARSKVKAEDKEAQVDVYTLATENLYDLPPDLHFDGLFSNFSGLNCVQNLKGTAHEIASRLKPGAPLLLCLSARFCLWELLYFSLQSDFKKAMRRCGGTARARIGTQDFLVYYPTISRLRRDFGSDFRLISVTGVGITVPPSYLESWILRHPLLHDSLKKIDSAIRTWPLLRTMGDHVLLHMERV